ncbi:hypothetical protein F9K73_16245 [Brucella intermedia]|uniref:hypothetical protein n=1 Tax=Brucella intermedia TaxID=94625 RepID=UPI00124D8C6C|nr:hypothetical protein [Brucella intermedia]KAB2719180.1 hypothetical protein F9K73_16245 [Brucella intermedia]
MMRSHGQQWRLRIIPLALAQAKPTALCSAGTEPAKSSCGDFTRVISKMELQVQSLDSERIIDR